MTLPTSTQVQAGKFGMVTCFEARPGDGHAVIGENAVFDELGKAMFYAHLAVRLYKEILEASRMGRWQFWYRVETTQTNESHRTGDADTTVDVLEWKIKTNNDAMPIYRVVLFIASEPLNPNLEADPNSDLQTVFRRLNATGDRPARQAPIIDQL
jgi:hypothetical protein